MVTEKQLAEEKLAEYFYITGTHTVSSKGVVDVVGNVTYTRSAMDNMPDTLPVQFGKVKGEFWAVEKGLKNWNNFPREVTGVFVASGNEIEDWHNCPRSVGSLIVNDNPISSLEGMPVVSRSLSLNGCGLKNFQGMRSFVDHYVSVVNNPLESLDGFQGCHGYIALTYHKELPLLKTLMAQGGVYLYPVGDNYQNTPAMKKLEPLQAILNRYKGQGQSGAIACAAEMAQAGFKGNARW